MAIFFLLTPIPASAATWAITAGLRVHTSALHFSANASTYEISWPDLTTLQAGAEFTVSLQPTDMYGNLIEAPDVEPVFVEIHHSGPLGGRRVQAQDAQDGSPDPLLVGQFTMRYDYVAKVHRAICVVPANGTFSVSVATLGSRSPIRPLALPDAGVSASGSHLSEIVVAAVNCPPQTHASSDGAKCLLSWCAPGEELSATMEYCNRCTPGRFANDGNGHGVACDACPLGRFCEQVGCSECAECATGSISAPLRTECSSCSHGLTPNASLDGCALCAIGKKGSFAVFGTCELCDIGKVSTDARGRCKECPTSDGFTSSADGKQCICATGTYSLDARATFSWGGVGSGLGRIVALCLRSSTSYENR